MLGLEQSLLAALCPAPCPWEGTTAGKQNPERKRGNICGEEVAGHCMCGWRTALNLALFRL